MNDSGNKTEKTGHVVCPRPIELPERWDSLPAKSQVNSPLQVISKLVAGGAGTEVIQQMKDLVEWQDKREAESQFNSSFANARKNFKKAKRSGYNEHLGASYSRLSDYDDATRDALSEYGLAWRHQLFEESGNIRVRCILSHSSGHSESTELSAPAGVGLNKAVNSLQSAGIVCTYLKRMTLSAMLGIVSDDETEFDNDGELSERKNKASKNSKPASSNSGNLVSQAQLKLLRAKIKSYGKTEEEICKKLGVDSLESVHAGVINKALEFIEG